MHQQVLNATKCETDSNILSTYIKPCRYNYINLIFLAEELQRFLQITNWRNPYFKIAIHSGDVEANEEFAVYFSRTQMC